MTERTRFSTNSLVVWRIFDSRRGHDTQSLGLINALSRRVSCVSHDIPASSLNFWFWQFLLKKYPPGYGLPKPHLIIIGRGALKETLVRQAGRLAVDMTIIDVVPHLELPKYYQSADVYVQPSLAEAPVKTLLEAMSCQCACVGTRVPGISGVLEDGKNGLLASLETKDLQKKIQQVLNNPKTAKKLGEQARVTIINRFNIKKMINKEISILKSI